MVNVRQFDADVCVAGGGPAGLATAIAAAMRGLSVIVVDAARPPLDKACGEGLMPDALADLAALGVSLRGIESAPFAGIRFVGPRHRAEACFSNGIGQGVRRTELHGLLMARAEELGVRFVWGSRITGLDREFVSLDSRLIRARWIVGADGLQSRIQRWAGLDAGRVMSRRIGLRRHYHTAPWSRFVEIYWGKHGQAYVAPVGSEQVCVAFISREKLSSVEKMLNSVPQLKEKLVGAPCTGPPRGALTIARKLKRCTRNHVALVGDASGSVDAITGEGLAIRFRQAACLADALAIGDLASYEEACRGIRRVPLFMSQTMLLMDHSRLVRNYTLRAFERSPQLFARMLRVHVGESQLHWLGDAGVLQLGWQLLTT
jgi:flavin-dependent dehydrogenase